MKDPRSPCDLHLHSCYSDGRMTPAQLVTKALEAGLAAISVTDHDTIAGQEEALLASSDKAVEVLTGVEFSAKENGKDIHILGYLFDCNEKRLTTLLARLEKARSDRAELMTEKLNKAGLEISFEEVMRISGISGTIGRLHIARVLLEKGYITAIQEAFSKYLGKGRSAYVPRMVLTASEAISRIRDAGGVAVWAHPGVLVRRKNLIDSLLRSGLSGIEAWHPNHSGEMAIEIRDIAEKHDLAATGGSDYHFDEAMKASIGGTAVTYQSVIDLKKMI
ncbi:MAG: PHP domain-containing protein [Candidatus Krumholzibacteriota bacterium]|nr:PHP domain-containing protein [Candidatus Krumholzibacteriota bacterium]